MILEFSFYFWSTILYWNLNIWMVKYIVMQDKSGFQNVLPKLVSMQKFILIAYISVIEKAKGKYTSGSKRQQPRYRATTSNLQSTNQNTLDKFWTEPIIKLFCETTQYSDPSLNQLAQCD